MGLFSNTAIDKGIAFLFHSRTRKDDLAGEKGTTAERPSKEESSEASTAAKPVNEAQVDKNENNDDVLEDEYVRKIARKEGLVKAPVEEPAEDAVEDAGDASDSDSSEDEDVNEDAEATEGSETKSDSSDVPKPEKTEDLERTVFVKNVPNTVITDRKAFKDFKRLFGPEIQSVRFRSIAVSEMVPRKVAFIKQKLHPARDAVNSYIVYKSKDRVFEVVNELNGREFMDHHLFVDNAAKPKPQVSNRSVFIGNLSFEATEEQLYRHFADCGEIENLRIVRDRKFNLGKGFAYVQFADVSPVQLALLKNGQDFNGRKLRVTRCSKKEQKKKSATVERSFKQKQTERSRQGKPKRQPKLAPGTVLEGERAKAGDAVELGRKRKNRHDKNNKSNKPKKARR